VPVLCEVNSKIARKDQLTTTNGWRITISPSLAAKMYCPAGKSDAAPDAISITPACEKMMDFTQTVNSSGADSSRCTAIWERSEALEI